MVRVHISPLFGPKYSCMLVEWGKHDKNFQFRVICICYRYRTLLLWYKMYKFVGKISRKAFTKLVTVKYDWIIAHDCKSYNVIFLSFTSQLIALLIANIKRYSFDKLIALLDFSFSSKETFWLPVREWLVSVSIGMTVLLKMAKMCRQSPVRNLNLTKWLSKPQIPCQARRTLLRTLSQVNKKWSYPGRLQIIPQME